MPASCATTRVAVRGRRLEMSVMAPCNTSLFRRCSSLLRVWFFMKARSMSMSGAFEGLDATAGASAACDENGREGTDAWPLWLWHGAHGEGLGVQRIGPTPLFVGLEPRCRTGCSVGPPGSASRNCQLYAAPGRHSNGCTAIVGPHGVGAGVARLQKKRCSRCCRPRRRSHRRRRFCRLGGGSLRCLGQSTRSPTW